MNIIDVLEIIYSIGYKISRKVIKDVILYIDSMLQDNRIIVIHKDGEPYAIVFFSICRDYLPYLEKPDFSYLSHDRNGDTIYIEKIIARGWDKTVRKQFESAILELYPNLRQAVFHRYADFGDRKVTIPRREYAEVSA